MQRSQKVIVIRSLRKAGDDACNHLADLMERNLKTSERLQRFLQGEKAGQKPYTLSPKPAIEKNRK